MIISGFPSTFSGKGRDKNSRKTIKKTVKKTRRTQRTVCPPHGGAGGG